VGDVVGVFLDTNDRTIVFSLNGELLVDPSAGDAAFTEIQGEQFVPACTLGIGQKCREVPTDICIFLPVGEGGGGR
jgi:ryanodine receptor 2